MFDPVNRTLVADRHQPFAHDIYLEGEDLTGKAFAMQVRDRWNGGMVRADLKTVATAAAVGIRVVEVTIEAGVPTTHFAIRINKTTMKAMPLAPEPDAPVPLVYDLVIERVAGMPEIMMRGAFIVREGSTES